MAGPDVEPPEGVEASEIELGYASERGRSVQVGQLLCWVFVLLSAALLALSRRRVT